MRQHFRVLGTNQEFVPGLRFRVAPPGAVPGKTASRLVPALGAAVATCAALAMVAGPAAAVTPAFLAGPNTVTTVASTVPANGDVNPYGIVNVPQSIGLLVQGDTLVSNFNASSNLQGTGTTIVQISPTGQQSLFAQINPSTLPGPCPGGVGLTTALSVLTGGFVVVGSLPVTNAGKGTPEAGCLIVLNSAGVPVETWAGGHINGPWDMTAVQFHNFAELFVTNVLNGTVAGGGNVVNQGTVVRILVSLPPGRNPVRVRSRVIATGFAEELNQAALVVGPTGVALAPNDVLYVADTVNSRIATVRAAGVRLTPATGGGTTLTSGGSLNGPLGMTLAPNGNIITVNAGDGNGVETTPQGDQIATVQLDPAGAGGDLFGLTVAPGGRSLLFVDDGDNTLKMFGPSNS
jgi:hypothetical protein